MSIIASESEDNGNTRKIPGLHRAFMSVHRINLTLTPALSSFGAGNNQTGMHIKKKIGDMDLGGYNIKLEIQLAVYNE